MREVHHLIQLAKRSLSFGGVLKLRGEVSQSRDVGHAEQKQAVRQ
jgi:hypothetical protein